jgi:hypothetical protein
MPDITLNGASNCAQHGAQHDAQHDGAQPGAQHGVRPNKRGHQPRNLAQRPLKQAVAIQNILFDSIIGKRKTRSSEVSLARSWAEIEERRRILMGKPLPGVLRPEAKPRKRRAITAQPIRTPQPVVSCGIDDGKKIVTIPQDGVSS